MEEKITYTVLEIHAPRIRELIKKKKYRNSDDFVKTAIEILLTWESSQPMECMELMRSLMPFSKEQEMFMKKTMNPDELKRQFGTLEIEQDYSELAQQKQLARTDYDHLELKENLKNIRSYIRELKISKPDNIIPFDGYPLLSGFYSRILPVKIVLTVLAQLLESSKTDRIELQELRVHAFDIAEEITMKLVKYENDNDVSRNKKISTGLPKKGKEDRDGEKTAMAQKRFKDQYIGKVRKNRINGENHFEGALSALGLVCAFNEGSKTCVSLTKLGKEFLLLENRILKDDYESGPLTKDESDFIMKRLIPQRELEKRFVDTAVAAVKKLQKKTKADSEKNTHTLDQQIRHTADRYLAENRDAKEKYNLSLSDPEIASRKITQWRLATLGRLSEMRVVNWNINEKGDSEYSLN